MNIAFIPVRGGSKSIPLKNIKELDNVMNGIAIVTDMTTSDLWNQIDAYTKMAQQYGTTIKGAYEVS